MPYEVTSDISRMLEVGQKEIFTKNFDNYPLEYPFYTVNKTSNKKTETYDSMSNLANGGEKVEGDAIKYSNVKQAYQTSVTNKTWANGFAHTIESIKYDLYGVVNSVKAKELARTMRVLEEKRAIRWIDGASTIALSDGQALASNSHPLIDSAEVNDTYATAGSIEDPDNHKTMINMFWDFKNHQGDVFKCDPKKGLTHKSNMMTVEEVYKSAQKAQEMSNTKNTLLNISWGYTTYSSSKTFYMMWDSSFDHIIFQWFMKTEFGNDEDKISTKNIYYNAIAMYETAALPNVGIVFNDGD